MIARLDHHPMLTAMLALTTAVLIVVVITLATLLITAAPQAATSSSYTDGGNPGVGAAPANMDAGGENYGHAAVLANPAKTGNFADPDIDRHAEVVAAHHGLQ
jgi:hypothetical protein